MGTQLKEYFTPRSVDLEDIKPAEQQVVVSVGHDGDNDHVHFESKKDCELIHDLSDHFRVRRVRIDLDSGKASFSIGHRSIPVGKLIQVLEGFSDDKAEIICMVLALETATVEAVLVTSSGKILKFLDPNEAWKRVHELPSGVS